MCDDAKVLADDNSRKLVLHEIHTDGLVGKGTDDQSLFDMTGRDMTKYYKSVACLAGECQHCFPIFKTQVGGGVLVLGLSTIR